MKDPVVCRTKGANSKSPIVKDSSRSKGGPVCGFCSKSGHNIRTCELAKESHAAVDLGPEPYPTASFVHNLNDSGRVHEYTESAAVTHTFSDEDSDDMIHHREEASAFDFYAGYDDQSNSKSGSMTTGSPNRNSRSSFYSHHSSTYNSHFPPSWPFSNTQ